MFPWPKRCGPGLRGVVHGLKEVPLSREGCLCPERAAFVLIGVPLPRGVPLSREVCPRPGRGISVQRGVPLGPSLKGVPMA